jgi:hypothetical protein
MFLNIHTENIQDYDGYVPIKDGVMTAGMAKAEPGFVTNSIIDTNMVDALKGIIRICKEKNITLYVVNSPIYHGINDAKRSLTPAGKLAIDILKENNVKYYDFTYDTAFAGHMEWFGDVNHLNDNGAKIFTNLVADKIIDDNPKVFLKESRSDLIH